MYNYNIDETESRSFFRYLIQWMEEQKMEQSQPKPEEYGKDWTHQKGIFDLLKFRPETSILFSNPLCKRHWPMQH